MNTRQARAAANKLYELYKLLKQDPNVIHCYLTMNPVIFDPSVQVRTVADVLEIAKNARSKVVVHRNEDEDISDGIFPFEVGVTIESCYFFANAEQSDLDEHELTVTEDN